MNNTVSDVSFWSNEGWILNLAGYDDNLVVFSGNKRLRVRPVYDGVVVGPFNSMVQMQDWYDQFLQRQSLYSQGVDNTNSLSIVPDVIEFNLVPARAAA